MTTRTTTTTEIISVGHGDTRRMKTGVTKVEVIEIDHQPGTVIAAVDMVDTVVNDTVRKDIVMLTSTDRNHEMIIHEKVVQIMTHQNMTHIQDTKVQNRESLLLE